MGKLCLSEDVKLRLRLSLDIRILLSALILTAVLLFFALKTKWNLGDNKMGHNQILDLGRTEPGYHINQCTAGKKGWSGIETKLFDGKLIILSNSNFGYAPLVINFIETVSQWDQVVPLVVMEDCKAYQCLSNIVSDEYLLPPLYQVDDGDAKTFNSKSFGTLVASRPVYIHFFLARSHDVFWVDIDSTFLGNPLSYPSNIADVSLIDDWRAKDVKKELYFCSCFIYLRSNYKTMLFMENWRSLMLSGSTMNQWAFNEALNTTAWQFQLIYTVMPRSVFPNGADYPQYRRTAIWAHANWRTGRKAKIDFLLDSGVDFFSLEKTVDELCSGG